MTNQRRQVLKGMAAFSVIAAETYCSGAALNLRDDQPAVAATPSPCAGKFPRINIVLHGMYALIFDKTKKRLTVLVPNVPGHVFGVGNFGSEQELPSSTVANPHTLTNTGAGNFSGPPIGSTDNVVVSWSKSISGLGDAPYCAFDLPFPDCFIPLRVYDPGVPLFLSGTTVKDNSLNAVVSIPIINVLTYTSVQLNPNLAGVSLVADPSGVYHAHIFAEPAFAPGPSSMHSAAAIAVLNTLFDPPLDLRLNPQIVKPLPAPVSTEPGVAKSEQYSLVELRQTAAPLAGGHPRNCLSINVLKP